jgi:hypothetical protein
VPANTAAPKDDLFDGIGRLEDDAEPGAIRDAGQPDAISAAVGRAGYLSPYMEAFADGHEAVFDRYYFPTGDSKAVFVDAVSGGIERAHEEAEKQVALKRKWCKSRRVRYIVFVEDTVTV